MKFLESIELKENYKILRLRIGVFCRYCGNIWNIFIQSKLMQKNLVNTMQYHFLRKYNAAAIELCHVRLATFDTQ